MKYLVIFPMLQSYLMAQLFYLLDAPSFGFLAGFGLLVLLVGIGLLALIILVIKKIRKK